MDQLKQSASLVLGIGSDDCAVDWVSGPVGMVEKEALKTDTTHILQWALGVVMYEFLYSCPPFHAETPEKVFDNIISRRIDWYEGLLEISPEARHLMERLMCMDPKQRLGTRGASEVKSHPWFAGLDWNNLMTTEANFVPNITDPESTDYFDARGAKPQVFNDEHAGDAGKVTKTSPTSASKATVDSSDHERYVADDFGPFTYKNLGELKQANDDVIRKMRTDQMTPIGQPLPRDRRLSVVAKMSPKPRGSISDVRVILGRRKSELTRFSATR